MGFFINQIGTPNCDNSLINIKDDTIIVDLPLDLYVDDANLNKYYDELDMYNINVVGKVICTDDSPIITISSPFNSNISSTF